MLETAAKLEHKLATVRSIHDIQVLLAAEGLEMSDTEIVQGLIAEGASPRYSDLSPEAQAQVAQLLVLAERKPDIAEALVHPLDSGTALAALAEAEGLALDPQAQAALQQPLDLNDDQLEGVVGGLDPVTAGLISLGITTLGAVLMHWINRHYDARLAETKTTA